MHEREGRIGTGMEWLGAEDNRKMKGRNEKKTSKRGNEQERTPSRQNSLEGQARFHSRLKAVLSLLLNLSLCLSCLESLSRSIQPQSSECMSHMPHSHDIVGPGTARGTSHTQDLLLCIAHTALEQEERKGVNSPSRSGSDSWLFHKRTKKNWACIVPPLWLISQVRNCLSEHAKDNHSMRQAIFSSGQVMFIGKQ